MRVSESEFWPAKMKLTIHMLNCNAQKAYAKIETSPLITHIFERGRILNEETQERNNSEH